MVSLLNVALPILAPRCQLVRRTSPILLVTKRCSQHRMLRRLDYTWIDQNRRPVKLAAPTYIDYVMTWVQNLLDDEATFPTKAGEN